MPGSSPAVKSEPLCEVSSAPALSAPPPGAPGSPLGPNQLGSPLGHSGLPTHLQHLPSCTPLASDPITQRQICSCVAQYQRLASGAMYGPPALSPPIGVPPPSAASAPKATPDPQAATAAALQAAAAAGFLPLGGAEGVPSAFYPPGANPGGVPTPGAGGLELKENLEAWRNLSPAAAAYAQMYSAGYPYDPSAAPLAGYPFAGYGMDLNGARRKNATRETTSTLKAWLNEHRKNPYPTKGEKIMLAIITRMTLTQVSTWFANARRRLKKENKMTWSPRNRGDEEDDDDDDIDNDSSSKDDNHHSSSRERESDSHEQMHSGNIGGVAADSARSQHEAANQNRARLMAAEEMARRSERLAQLMASSGLPPPPPTSLLSIGAMAANIGANIGPGSGPMGAHMAHIHSLLQLRTTQQHREEQLQRQQQQHQPQQQQNNPEEKSDEEVDVEDRDEVDRRDKAKIIIKALSSSPSPVQSLGARPKIWSLVDTATEAEGSPCASPSSSPRHPTLTPDQLLAASRLYGQHAQAVHKQWCQAFAQSALQQQQQTQSQQQPLQPPKRQRTPSPEAGSLSSPS